jgi:hypothetical protein
MLAARSAALLTASPLGAALGGPLTTALGPRATLGGSGLATVALSAVACVLLLARRRKQWARDPGAPLVHVHRIDEQPLHRTGRLAAQQLSARRGEHNGRHTVMRRETGHQTDQESRSAAHRPAISLTATDITIHG